MKCTAEPQRRSEARLRSRILTDSLVVTKEERNVKKPAWIAPDGLLRWDEAAMTMRCNPWPQVLDGDVRRGFCGCAPLHIYYTTLCLKYQPIPHTPIPGA